MQIQFHPASGRGTVRTISLSAAAERTLAGGAGALLVLSASLWFTVPLLAARAAREGAAGRVVAELDVRRAEWNAAAETARALRRRALDGGDLINRIGFLYAVQSAAWPQLLNPERGALAAGDPEKLAAALTLYLRGLDRAEAIVAEIERRNPGLPARTPSIVPIRDEVSEPSAFFGPRRSPWTGEEEFFLGADLAAPAGSPVVAPAAGTVAFAGTIRRSSAGWFWRLGSVVVLSHEEGGATVFGHLSRVDVRRGQKVSRGQRLGSVGSSGWAIAPQLHYEYWRRQGESLLPTDPLFATLDQRLGRRPLSVEQMEAASAPGPFDLLPGIQVSPEQVAGRDRPEAPRGRGKRVRPRI